MPVAELPGRRVLLALLVVLGALAAAGWPSPAWAHTDFESSNPAEGQIVAGPLERVTVTFTSPASPSGEGFVVLDALGAPVAPLSVETADGAVFVLTFDPPLAPGAYGIRWEVQAGTRRPDRGPSREHPGGSGIKGADLLYHAA